MGKQNMDKGKLIRQRFTSEELKAMSRNASKTKNKYQHYGVKRSDGQYEYVSRGNIIKFKELHKLCKKYGYKWQYIGELTCSLKRLKPDEVIYEKCSLKTALKYLRKIKVEQKKKTKSEHNN
jgi:hypothetical protein